MTLYRVTATTLPIEGACLLHGATFTRDEMVAITEGELHVAMSDELIAEHVAAGRLEAIDDETPAPKPRGKR